MTSNYINSSNYKSVSERREEDHKKEQMVSDFLNKYVYPLFNAENIETVSDRDRQLKGIDKIFTINGEKFLCDEKATTGGMYWNMFHVNNYGKSDYRELKTFCLECFQRPRNSSEHVYGWYLDPSKETNSYLFVWVKSATSSEENQDMFNSMDDINEIVCTLVRKSDIQKYLRGLGITEEILESTCEEVLNMGDDPRNQPSKFINGKKIMKLTSLTEKPVNILVYEDEYEKMSVCSVHLRKRDGKYFRVRARKN